MNYNRLTFPSAENSLIKLQDVKDHLRIKDGTEDTLIQAYLNTAIFHYEDFTGRIVNVSEFKCTLDSFPSNGKLVELMRYPVKAIQEIKFVDADGADQVLVLEDCRIDYSEPLRLAPALNKSWPVVAPVLGAITIKFECGYADVASLRPSARQAILMMVGHFYNNRESVVVGRVTNEVPHSARMLMENDKISNRF